MQVSPAFYLTLIYSSSCFGRPHAHHQELSNCRSSLWFHLRCVVVAVLLVVFGPAQPQPTALLSPRSEGKTRGCSCSCWAPDDGREDARNMLCCKWASSNMLEKLLHLVGDLSESEVSSHSLLLVAHIFTSSLFSYCWNVCSLWLKHCNRQLK